MGWSPAHRRHRNVEESGTRAKRRKWMGVKAQRALVCKYCGTHMNEIQGYMILSYNLPESKFKWNAAAWSGFCKRRRQTQLQENFTLGGPTWCEDHYVSVFCSVTGATLQSVRTHTHILCSFCNPGFRIVQSLFSASGMKGIFIWICLLYSCFTGFQNFNKTCYEWINAAELWWGQISWWVGHQTLQIAMKYGICISWSADDDLMIYLDHRQETSPKDKR